MIARFGVGYDQVDVPAATRHGVYVAMAFGGNHEAVADLALALMGAVSRDIVAYHGRVVRGGWGWEFRPGMWRATVGIVGLGRIGRAVARRCRGFEMRILAHDTVPDAEYARAHGIELTSLETLLRESDFVTLHAPHTPETDRLINDRPAAPDEALGVPHQHRARRPGRRDRPRRRVARAPDPGPGLDVFRQEPPRARPCSRSRTSSSLRTPPAPIWPPRRDLGPVRGLHPGGGPRRAAGGAASPQSRGEGGRAQPPRASRLSGPSPGVAVVSDLRSVRGVARLPSFLRRSVSGRGTPELTRRLAIGRRPSARPPHRLRAPTSPLRAPAPPRRLRVRGSRSARPRRRGRGDAARAADRGRVSHGG